MYLFELQFCPGIFPGVELLDHMVSLFLVFRGISILFSIVAAQTYIPTNSVGELKGKLLLIRTLALWGDGGLSVPQKPPPKILLSHENF